MKRFFFSVIAIAMAATACTESGLIDTPSFYKSEIRFDPYIGKSPVTKAEDVNVEYLKRSLAQGGGVQIYAFMHDAGDGNVSSMDVTNPYIDAPLTFSNNEWSYGEVAYWPEGKALSFAAYSLNAENLNAVPCISNHDTPTEFDFTVNDVVSQQVDLLVTPFKPNVVGGATDTEINLVFEHLLSRVGFSVVATNADENISVAIQSIKLCGIFPKKGKVNLLETDPAIHVYSNDVFASEYNLFDNSATCFMANSTDCTGARGKAIYNNVNLNLEINPYDGSKWAEMYPSKFTQESATDRTNADKTALENRYMMIMPGTVHNARIEVRYHLTADQTRFAEVELGDWEFKPGYAYEFILSVSTASIKFDATFGGWGDAETTTKPLVPVI